MILEHLLDTLNMHPTPLENFLEASKVKVVTQKLLKFNRKSRVSTLNFAWISQKSAFCYFSCIKNGLRSRMVTEVGALDRCDLRASLKYLEQTYQTSEKCFRTIWSQSGHSKIGSNSLDNLGSQPFNLSNFWVTTLTSEASKNVLDVWDACSRYLRGAPRSHLSSAPTLVTTRLCNPF